MEEIMKELAVQVENIKNLRKAIKDKSPIVNTHIKNNGIHSATSISRLDNDIPTSFKIEVPYPDLALRNVSDRMTIQSAKV